MDRSKRNADKPTRQKRPIPKDVRDIGWLKAAPNRIKVIKVLG